MIRFLSRNLVDEITNIIIMLMQTTNVILSPDTSNAFCKQSNAHVLVCTYNYLRQWLTENIFQGPEKNLTSKGFDGKQPKKVIFE